MTKRVSSKLRLEPEKFVVSINLKLWAADHNFKLNETMVHCCRSAASKDKFESLCDSKTLVNLKIRVTWTLPQLQTTPGGGRAFLPEPIFKVRPICWLGTDQGRDTDFKLWPMSPLEGH